MMNGTCNFECRRLAGWLKLGLICRQHRIFKPSLPWSLFSKIFLVACFLKVHFFTKSMIVNELFNPRCSSSINVSYFRNCSSSPASGFLKGSCYLWMNRSEGFIWSHGLLKSICDCCLEHVLIKCPGKFVVWFVNGGSSWNFVLSVVSLVLFMRLMKSQNEERLFFSSTLFFLSCIEDIFK